MAISSEVSMFVAVSPVVSGDDVGVVADADAAAASEAATTGSALAVVVLVGAGVAVTFVGFVVPLLLDETVSS